jgi:hypothetical protein
MCSVVDCYEEGTRTHGERGSARLDRESEGWALSRVQGQSLWSGGQGDEVRLKLTKNVIRNVMFLL